MKRFFTLMLTVLLIAGTATAVQAQDKKQKKAANIQEVTFVTTIDCKNCVKKVEANLPYEKGIKRAKQLPSRGKSCPRSFFHRDRPGLLQPKSGCWSTRDTECHA